MDPFFQNLGVCLPAKKTKKKVFHRKMEMKTNRLIKTWSIDFA